MVNVLAPPRSGSVVHSPLYLEWMVQLGHQASVHSFDLGSRDALVEISQQIVVRNE